MGEAELGPDLTQCDQSRVPSFIFVHPTIWPQYTNVSDRQKDRQQSDSIGHPKTISDFNEARDDGVAVASAGPYGN